MIRSARAVLAGACLILLGACVTPPVAPADGVELNPTAPNKIDSESRGTVWWGGVILGTQTIETGTRLELLAYPLDSIGRPLLNRASRGRFIAFNSEYLEPVDYSEGRTLTLVGVLDGDTDVSIGQSSQSVPTVRISDHHLWRPDDLRGRSRVTFGIGINISN